MQQMTHDARTVFEKWMAQGYEKEHKAKWSSALNVYENCKELADMYEDIPCGKRAQERIDHCKIQLEETKFRS